VRREQASQEVSNAKSQKRKEREVEDWMFLALRALHLGDFALEAGFGCPAESLFFNN
jgi:hypothetical protein